MAGSIPWTGSSTPWESRFDEFQSQMDRQIAALRERMAHLEGILKGLQETIVRRSGTD